MSKNKSSGRITGSRAGAILGLSPWSTPDDVMREMVRRWHGAPSEFEGNIATEWGQRHESEARLAFMGATGFMVSKPKEFITPYRNWLGAITDGLVHETENLNQIDAILEIKSPYGMAKKEKPEWKSIREQPHYYAQAQVEMFCEKQKRAYFFQYRPAFGAHEAAHSLEIVEIDGAWITENLPRLWEFYQKFQIEVENPAKHLAPKSKPKDHPTMPSSDEIEAAALGIIKSIDEIDDVVGKLTENRKKLIEDLKALAGDESAVWGDRKFTRVERKGAVSYTQFFKDHPTDVDLDQYRGAPSVSWRLS